MLLHASNYPIGLDISDLSLRALQLNKFGDSIKIQAVGKIDLARGLIEDGEIKNKAEVLRAIKTLLDKPGSGKISSREIVACLPDTKTFIKLIEVEKTPNDFEEVIRSEMEKHIPLSLDEIYFDWQIIKDLPAKQLVLVGAAPKNIVDQYTALVDEAGLTLTALEIESVAICRSLLAEENYRFKGPSKTNCGIIDIGAKRTSMTVYTGGAILFTMSIPISGEKITEEIARDLKIDIAQAEKAKIICGLDDSKAQGIIRGILSGMINDLVAKIKEVIKYYQYHFPGYAPIERIQLCGGGANIEDIDGILSKALSLEVTVGNPLTNLNETPEKLSEILKEADKPSGDSAKKTAAAKIDSAGPDSRPTYATAVGLALRGIFIDEL